MIDLKRTLTIEAKMVNLLMRLKCSLRIETHGETHYRACVMCDGIGRMTDVRIVIFNIIPRCVS